MAERAAEFAEIRCFADVKHWLDSLLDQTAGDPAAICETGEKYKEFYASGLARPGDEAVIEAFVAQQMYAKLNAYFVERSGRIYWRIPFESEIAGHQVVVRYDEQGPDMDFLMDRKCVADKNWRAVKCYCRLYRATHKTVERVSAAKAA